MLTSTITPTGGVTVMVRPAIFLVNFLIMLGRCYSQHLLILCLFIVSSKVYDVIMTSFVMQHNDIIKSGIMKVFSCQNVKNP